MFFVKVWVREEGEGGGRRRDPNATIFLGGLTHEHIFFVQKLACYGTWDFGTLAIPQASTCVTFEKTSFI